MGDYGIYIWPAYGVTAVIMLLILSFSLIQLKQAKKQLAIFLEQDFSKRRVK